MNQVNIPPPGLYAVDPKLHPFVDDVTLNMTQVEHHRV